MPATIRVNRKGETMKWVFFFIEMPWYERLVKLAQKEDRTVTNLTAVAMKEYENGENAKLAKQVREAGLTYQFVHAPFDKCHYLWEEEEKGEEECLRLVRCLRDCADIKVPLVIMHAIIGMERNTPTALGVERFCYYPAKFREYRRQNATVGKPCGCKLKKFTFLT